MIHAGLPQFLRRCAAVTILSLAIVEQGEKKYIIKNWAEKPSGFYLPSNTMFLSMKCEEGKNGKFGELCRYRYRL